MVESLVYICQFLLSSARLNPSLSVSHNFPNSLKSLLRWSIVAHQPAELMGSAAEIAAHLIPRRGSLIGTLREELAPVVGEGEQLAPLALLGADQALVLELLQRRVDRPRARPPHAAAALLHLLHDLVAVARLLGEQQQRRRADVSAAVIAPAPAGSSAGGEAAEGKAPELA